MQVGKEGVIQQDQLVWGKRKFTFFLFIYHSDKTKQFTLQK